MTGRRQYQLALVNIGDMSYVVMSKGHHDLDSFMQLVVSEYPGRPIGRPRHGWYRCVPDNEAQRTALVPAVPHSRGAFPVTVAIESYGADRWAVPTTTAA